MDSITFVVYSIIQAADSSIEHVSYITRRYKLLDALYAINHAL